MFWLSLRKPAALEIVGSASVASGAGEAPMSGANVSDKSDAASTNTAARPDPLFDAMVGLLLIAPERATDPSTLCQGFGSRIVGFNCICLLRINRIHLRSLSI